MIESIHTLCFPVPLFYVHELLQTERKKQNQLEEAKD